MSEVPVSVLSLVPAAKDASRPGLLREPLLHFLLLGGLLFIADARLEARRDDPHTIHLDAAVDREARDVFLASRGREPTPDELVALRKVWLDNEVLYREGLAMQVDRGDSAIRERVIFKALSLVDANVKLEEPDEARLRAWFEERRAKYDEPARYDFEEAVLPGDASEESIRRLVATLNAANSGEVAASLRVFRGRPEPSLSQGYGETFAAELAQSDPREWRAFRTRNSWRAIRLLSTTPPRAADFAVVAPVVLQDWRDATASEQRSAAVHELARKYRIVVDEAAVR